MSVALGSLGPHSPVADRLRAARELPKPLAASERVAAQKRALDEAISDLSFEPVAEAELPEGFPTYTPVGAIEVKQYPAYRMASGPGFWALFRHIKSNNIAMTAPVEMTYSQSRDGRLQQAGMAFLYGAVELGKTGKDGKVSVEDAPGQEVVAIGVRGTRTVEVIADSESRLRKWIDSQDAYTASGPLRVMGYNSPFVPRDKQYFEVQLPIKKSSEN
jgi:hypothetical protein